MEACPICQHAKIDAIDTALDNGVAPGIVMRRYRLQPLLFGRHVAHRTQDYLALQSRDNTTVLAELLREKHDTPPFRRFQQAWHDAKDDDAERLRMISWLNDQLQQDDMGLP